MNWINMLPWYQWLILGIVPPLIFLLYFLKLKRNPVEVPSTYLWSKTVEDMHVNSIWQRLRKNILLLLQLLVILLLILSCLRPGCDGEQLAGDRFIFLVDQSASMSAKDGKDGSSRLEDAKNQIESLIGQMKSSDAAMVISFSDREGVDQSYTTNEGLLKRKVKAIEQTQRGSDMNRALQAASGLANPGRTSDRTNKFDIQVADAVPATLYIFSDGAVKKIPDFFLGNLSPEYHPIGSFDPPENVGITAFSINDQLQSDGQVQVFARLQNSGMKDKQVNISLTFAGELVDARSVNVPGLGASSQNFDLSPLMEGLQQAAPIKLKIEDEDLYMQDNEAYCVLNPPRISTVLLVTDHNTYLELATQTEHIKNFANVEIQDRDFLKTKTYQDNAALGVYDLIMYDQCSPDSMPTCNTVFWNALPPGDRWKSTAELESTPIIDVNSGHPLMYDVKMGSVLISKSNVLEGPQGSIPLVQSVKGPVMVIGPRGSFQDLVIGFSLVEYTEAGDIVINTNWYKNLGFPFFIQNTLITLGVGGRFDATRSISPGEIVKLKPQLPYPEIEVTAPNGTRSTLTPRSDGTFVYTNTDLSGIYEVRAKGSNAIDQLFAVNLLDRLESDLSVREKLNLGYSEVERTVSSIPARKDFWTWIVLLALVVISVEWFIYNRRVFI